MSTLAPAVQLRDLVPAETVDDLIAAVTSGLDQLYQQVQQAEQDALDAEVRLAELHAVPDGSRGNRVDQLRDSIDELSWGGTEYFRKEIESAHARAAARLAEANAHGEWLLMDAREQVAARLAVAGSASEAAALVPPAITPEITPDPEPEAPAEWAPAPAAETRVQTVVQGDNDQETELFRGFWPPERDRAVQLGPLRATSTALVPVLVAAMAALVLLVLVAVLAWIG